MSLSNVLRLILPVGKRSNPQGLHESDKVLSICRQVWWPWIEISGSLQQREGLDRRCSAAEGLIPTDDGVDQSKACSPFVNRADYPQLEFRPRSSDPTDACKPELNLLCFVFLPNLPCSMRPLTIVQTRDIRVHKLIQMQNIQYSNEQIYDPPIALMTNIWSSRHLS